MRTAKQLDSPPKALLEEIGIPRARVTLQSSKNLSFPDTRTAKQLDDPSPDCQPPEVEPWFCGSLPPSSLMAQRRRPAQTAFSVCPAVKQLDGRTMFVAALSKTQPKTITFTAARQQLPRATKQLDDTVLGQLHPAAKQLDDRMSEELLPSSLAEERHVYNTATLTANQHVTCRGRGTNRRVIPTRHMQSDHTSHQCVRQSSFHEDSSPSQLNSDTEKMICASKCPNMVHGGRSNLVHCSADHHHHAQATSARTTVLHDNRRVLRTC